MPFEYRGQVRRERRVVQFPTRLGRHLLDVDHLPHITAAQPDHRRRKPLLRGEFLHLRPAHAQQGAQVPRAQHPPAVCRLHRECRIHLPIPSLVVIDLVYERIESNPTRKSSLTSIAGNSPAAGLTLWPVPRVWPIQSTAGTRD